MIKRFSNTLANRLMGIWVLLFLFLDTCTKSNTNASTPVVTGRAYYVSADGNDSNDGSVNAPLKSLDKLNDAVLNAGDSILLRGGQIFQGQLKFQSNESGTNDSPIIVTSYGSGRAIINGGNGIALSTYGSYLQISKLILKGAGRKEGNNENGLVVSNAHHIRVDSVEISGFQKAGLLVNVSNYIDVNRIYSHDNGLAGIYIAGSYGNRDCNNIKVTNCVAENNPGDPTNLTNHSGNGIVAGFSKNVLIDQCTAFNNGWDMPRIGNGPVGIWCFESDSVIIQRCISYKNKTSVGGEDGGGYDLDGGVTNTIIQYCLSYDNQGSGFGIFQYAGASKWHNNIIRFNVSQNDGNVSAAHAGIYVWNSSEKESDFSDLLFYNNVIYNPGGAAISYSRQSNNAGFKFYNNIFVSKDTLVRGTEQSVEYKGNNWWSLRDTFNIKGIRTLNEWANANGKEQMNGKVIGFNIDPAFKNAGEMMITDPLQLPLFNVYHLPSDSPLKEMGLDLKALFGVDHGTKDFNQHALSVTNGIGACF